MASHAQENHKEQDTQTSTGYHAVPPYGSRDDYPWWAGAVHPWGLQAQQLRQEAGTRTTPLLANNFQVMNAVRTSNPP